MTIRATTPNREALRDHPERGAERGRARRSASPGESVEAEAGFSLTELLITLTVVGFVLSALSSILVGEQQRLETRTRDLTMLQGARLAMSRVTQEVRTAGYGTMELFEAVSLATPTRLQIVADIDFGSRDRPCRDEDGMDGLERVTFVLEDGNLQRSVDCLDGSDWDPEEALQTITGAVLTTDEEPLFRYFDDSGVELAPGSVLSAAERARIATVSISLRVADPNEGEETTPGSGTYHLRGRARIRNAGLSS
jgi:prepilin-type N-terminal cleavage/methylation domain-containing protein